MGCLHGGKATSSNRCRFSTTCMVCATTLQRCESVQARQQHTLLTNSPKNMPAERLWPGHRGDKLSTALSHAPAHTRFHLC